MELSIREVQVSTEWSSHNVALVANEMLIALVSLNDYFTEERQPDPILPDWKLTIENEPSDGWRVACVIIADQRIDHLLLYRKVEEGKILDFLKIIIDLAQDVPIIYQGIVRAEGDEVHSAEDTLQRQVLDIFERESPAFVTF